MHLLEIYLFGFLLQLSFSLSVSQGTIHVLFVIEKGAFGLPSTMVANFTLYVLYIGRQVMGL